MQIRTDLAVEAKEMLEGHEKGIETTEKDFGDMKITRMKVKTDTAARELQKEKGTYITAQLPGLTDDFKDTDKRLEQIGKEIRDLLPKRGLILVAGLGNINITPDALGPKTAAQTLATRHITGEIARSTGLDALRPVAVLSPGVLGQTGIETGELIFSIAETIKPAAVIAIDALASRRLERLGCTVQISDTGISPGSGVGNNRVQINQKSMGIPVIGIGVPTVVDALTLATDLLLSGDLESKEQILKSVSPGGQKMVVTPREIDLLTDRGARLLSMSINCALHPDFEIKDLISLVG